MTREEAEVFGAAMAKRLQGLKKDFGAKHVKQNYRGTGSQSFRRQVWVRFNDGTGTDIWVEGPVVSIGGVFDRYYGHARFDAADGDVERVYAALVAELKTRMAAATSAA